MFKVFSIVAIFLIFSTNVFAYDHNKAKSFDKFYSKFTQKACADSKLFIKAEDVMKMVVKNDNYVFLDVRTAAEKSVIAVSDKHTISVELKDLFQAKNLNKLPNDKTILILCHSGTRATMAAVGLLQVGFKNLHVIKGGLVALSSADTPKNAPMR